MEALLGLNVLFEVLMTMSQIMSPFTPFFAEYLYQNLRKLQPLYGNLDNTVAVDSSGNVIMILCVCDNSVKLSSLSADYTIANYYDSVSYSDNSDITLQKQECTA